MPYLILFCLVALVAVFTNIMVAGYVLGLALIGIGLSGILDDQKLRSIRGRRMRNIATTGRT